MVFKLLQSTMLVFTVCLVLVITSAGNFKVSAEAQQYIYEAKTLEGGCPTTQDINTVRNELMQDIGPIVEQLLASETHTQQPTTGKSTELSTKLPTTGQSTEQSTGFPTTEQTTKQSTGLPTTEQTTEQSILTTIDPQYTCNGTPGWRQVVFINMTDTRYNCPPGLNLTSYSKRTCGRAQANRFNCSSTTFSIGGSEYSRVCGRIRGYQVGITGAFFGNLRYSQTIDGYYVDGVSLTHGPVGGRQHIWTFSGGLTEGDAGIHTRETCPCDTSNTGTGSPTFIGNNYFCESGLNSDWPGESAWGVPFLDDALWDGQNCTSTSTCCQLNNPPWFTKILPNPTTDDIELRLCSFTSVIGGDIALEIIELYTQ